MVRVVWAKLISFDLQSQIHKTYNIANIKGMHRVMLKYSHGLREELASIAEHNNMTVWIWARNDINFSMAADLIKLHKPGVK